MNYTHHHTEKYGWIIIQKGRDRVYVISSDWIGSFGVVIFDAPTVAAARKACGIKK